MKILNTRVASLLLSACCFTATTALAQPTATVTVGNTASTVGNYTMPINTYYGYSYVQQLYHASEINKPLGGTITMIRFYWSGGSSGLNNSNNWTLYMANTTKTSFSGGSDWVPPASLTQVFSGTITAPTTNQWIDFPLSTPFVYDGTSSIVVAGWENVAGYATYTSTFQATSATNTRSIGYYSDITPANPASPPNANGIYSSFPNVQFEFIVPPNNTGIDAILEPVEGVAFCSGPQVVKANVHNYGSNVVNNVQVHWSVNGVEQPFINYTTPIDMENTVAGPDAEVTLGIVDFPYTTPQAISVWTKMPNGVTDTHGANDSTSRSITAELLGINDFAIVPGDTTICEGDVLTLDAGEHPKSPIYIWNNGNLEQWLNTTTGGTFWVKVQNTDGCFARDTVTVTLHPDPVANSIAIVDNGDGTFTFNIIGAQNVDNFVWDFGNGVTRTGPGPHVIPYADGVYDATVVLSNQCGEITLTRVITATGVNDLSKLGRELQVFPNPGSDLVTIRPSGDLVIKEITVYNILGQKIHQVVVKDNRYQLSVKSFATGMYSIMIDTNKGMASKKLEVVR